MRALLLRFLPDSARPKKRDDLRRAQLTLVGCWIAAGFAIAISAMQAAWGLREAALASLAAGTLSALLPFWVRRTGRWRAAAGALTALIWLASLAVAVLSCGTMVAALYYIVLAAAVATLALGTRPGAVLGIVNSLVVVGLYALHAAGFVAPVTVSAEVGMGSAMRGALVFNVALAALVGAYEWLHAAALGDSAESERRYRTLADYGPDLIAEIDARGRIAHITGGGGELNALLQGRDAVGALHPDDRPAAVAVAQRLETQASVRVGPVRWQMTPGDEHWVEASVTRFPVEGERRLLVVARDVSARVHLEAQLRHSQKMQAVGQLASGLAHDFNNLLTIISGYAETLTGRLKGDAEAAAALEEIVRASDQGAALTRRLLGFSRPSAMQRSAIDLSQVVRDNEKMLRVMLGESVTLLLELSPTPAVVRADGGEIEQILVNLVSNARDALPSGGTVRIATLARDERAVLVVHDNGSGIEPALRERIFEPFFTTKPGRGTGLGLYVVYSIVTGLGGEIELQTDSGAGTRIAVSLPSEKSAGRSLAAKPRRDRAPGGTERILVVEDRDELRELLRSALAEAGYRVLVASDGIEALALDVRDRIDLVVTDVVMPRMSGTALVAALRENRPGLRALFISANTAELPGPDDSRDRLLSKPFRIQELKRAVREVLDEQ
jgi:PAS domain S-box-containing protein